MTKTELIDRVSEMTELTKKDTTRIVDAIFDSIMDALKTGDKVQLIGFGSFEVRDRPERTGRNPQTGAEIKISAKKAPVFKAGKALKDSVEK